MQKHIKTIKKEKTVDPFTKWGNKIEDKINDKIGDISNLSTLKDHFESHFKTESISSKKDEYRSKVKQEVVNGIIDLVIDKIVFTQSKQSYDEAMDTMGLKTKDGNQTENKSMVDKLKNTPSFKLTKEEQKNTVQILTDTFKGLGSWFQ